MRRGSREEWVAAVWLTVSAFLGINTFAVAAVAALADRSGPRWEWWLAVGGVGLAAWVSNWLLVAGQFRALRRFGAWVPVGRRSGAGALPYATVVTVGGALVWGVVLALV
jgi:hypothetical protein